MNIISFRRVKEPYGWLGNMSPYPIQYKGETYRTAEALFQSLRFDNEQIIAEIRAEKSPMQAKWTAKKYAESRKVVPLCEEDVNNMETVLRLKLDQHPELKKSLIESGDSQIIEDCTNRPQGTGLFWGAAKINDVWSGQNTLGKLWMRIRDEQTW